MKTINVIQLSTGYHVEVKVKKEYDFEPWEFDSIEDLREQLLDEGEFPRGEV